MYFCTFHEDKRTSFVERDVRRCIPCMGEDPFREIVVLSPRLLTQLGTGPSLPEYFFWAIVSSACRLPWFGHGQSE